MPPRHGSFLSWAILKNLKETQRQVLINTTSAYRTSPLQALCVVTNNSPIHLKLKQINELSNGARGPNNDTKAQITARILRNWQTSGTWQLPEDILIIYFLP